MGKLKHRPRTKCVTREQYIRTEARKGKGKQSHWDKPYRDFINTQYAIANVMDVDVSEFLLSCGMTTDEVHSVMSNVTDTNG